MPAGAHGGRVGRPPKYDAPRVAQTVKIPAPIMKIWKDLARERGSSQADLLIDLIAREGGVALKRSA